jgi:hypothetical protein
MTPGPANFDPRAVNLKNVAFYQVMLHTKYLRSRPCTFRLDDLLNTSFKNLFLALLTRCSIKQNHLDNFSKA